MQNSIVTTQSNIETNQHLMKGCSANFHEVKTEGLKEVFHMKL